MHSKLTTKLAQLTLALTLALLPTTTQADLATQINIPFERFTLDNGLTLLVHEDRKAPIVTVNIWYHVGSKNERPGITGFAHLFEHLMFNGSENYRGEWFLPLEKAGGTNLNGTTWFDRTNYFQTVPSPALDLVLWMESDRMGHFLGAITQEGLDTQRAVVQNEKRQGDNRPYGRAGYAQLAGMFPEGHPYRWSTIGSMADLNAATLEDVKDWFKTYYGAANAVLVLAGDISPAEARRKVEHYFADIPPGPALTRPERWVAKRTAPSRTVMQDEVAQARLTRSWNTPPFGDPDAVYLDIAARILADGKSSRLHQRLVQEDQLASQVAAAQIPLEIAGLFEIEAYAKPGTPLTQIEKAINQELADFLRRGPTKKELDRVRTAYFAQLIRGLEKTGGFAGKAQLLARYQTYLGDAARYRQTLETYDQATPAKVREAAERWLSNGDFNLEVHPRPRYQVADSGADRTSLPDPGPAPELQLPPLAQYQLTNGIQVLHMQRGDLPVITMSMLFDAGYAADPADRQGLAAFTAAMLSEGTRRHTALEFAQRAEELGALIRATANLDLNLLSLSALSQNLPASLELFADALRHPRFADRELDLTRSNWMDRIAQEKTDPQSLALRHLPPLLYGRGHPYAIPFTGSGTESSIAAIAAADLHRFHRRWLRPDNARLVVVGNLPPADLKPLLNQALGDWQPPDSAPGRKTIAQVAPPEQPIIYLLDKPGAPQSMVIGGQLIPPTPAADSLHLDMATRILGGNFNARLNMNLREDKGWAYGARLTATNARGQRPLLYYAPVQIDKTTAALQEIIREAQDYLGPRPATREELHRTREGILRSLPGRFETNTAVRRTLVDILRFDRPLDYIDRYQANLETLTLDQVKQAAQTHLTPPKTLWLIVGDLTKIEKPLRDSKIAEVKVLTPHEKTP